MNWTVADYTNDDGITWVFDADGRTVAGAYSREVAELIAKAPGLLATNARLTKGLEHYAADAIWEENCMTWIENDYLGEGPGWAVAREALAGTKEGE